MDTFKLTIRKDRQREDKSYIVFVRYTHDRKTVYLPTTMVAEKKDITSSYKFKANMTNCVGVIDSGYRGEVHVMFHGAHFPIYKVGDRIAQAIIMPIPEVEYTEADSLADSDRGTDGIGSTGLV